MKKYELTNETKVMFGCTLHRIRARISFITYDGNEIHAGDLGGWVENESNLEQDGNARVYGNARVSGNARVYGNALVSGDAWVYGDARVSGNARVFRTDHILVIGPVGSQAAYATFFRVNNREIWASCGRFLGSLDVFLQTKTHEDNKHARVYRAAVELAKTCIDLDADEPENE